ncbi:hypothetical protein HKD37_04G010145 [Glycine soja]
MECGKVSLWASHEDGHGRGLDYLKPDLTDGLVLITALCSLFLAIILAYIKKNCWNLDDPTIVFPGTCKARARGSEGSSSSASLAPASTPLASSAPAPPPSTLVPAPFSTSMQSSDVLVPMLQSLHHDLCLVMLSIHNLAQHRPIMSMEEFTTQEPQLEPWPQPKATPETTPQTSSVTTPGVEVSDEVYGAADIDYVADMVVAQNTWDPWPVTAKDIPQPAQDAPSLPQDEPTAAQEEP